MTLNEIIKDFKEQGLSFDEQIRFFDSPGSQIYLLSIYEGSDGKPVIDVGES